ncbi:TadE/TadG family type IV pilus assembly protein [Caulobacter sp. NIBR2454]|uniref:TadE/TadG family type IV pilus assembly protein n=1 Tax=Caulobacter sp. NIBR2454 TaxID=3015996 RepID=UPI0022B67E41|nr:TadE/TadG family type IV pilus assembly protein [Caulobacter sp. NIBR2454]
MRWRPPHIVRSFAADRRGAAAVEFGLVALPFTLLVFAIVELGLVFMASTTLHNALDAASRRVRTGEVQSAGQSAAAFKASVCEEMTWLSSRCDDLYLDVRTYASFAGMTPTNPVVDGDIDPEAMSFQPGGGGAIVLVRGYFRWRLITPLLNESLINLAGGQRMIMAGSAFRNEPFPW